MRGWVHTGCVTRCVSVKLGHTKCITRSLLLRLGSYWTRHLVLSVTAFTPALIELHGVVSRDTAGCVPILTETQRVTHPL